MGDGETLYGICFKLYGNVNHVEDICALNGMTDMNHVAAGQKLFTLVNTDDIWLNARIEETRIGQIRVGQDVAFTIDGYPGRTFSGRIYEINPAACSVFSLISTENVAGYFTKIMQRVPVKISLPRLDSPETDPGEPEVVFRIGMQGTIEIQL